MKVLFWLSLFIVFYTFFGYGILLYIIVRLKRILKPEEKAVYAFNDLPTCTLIVAAYNEVDDIREKIRNTLLLNSARKVRPCFCNGWVNGWYS
jgi:biofilm PGA synthesis N-glycosyltransferase PgaC